MEPSVDDVNASFGFLEVQPRRVVRDLKDPIFLFSDAVTWPTPTYRGVFFSHGEIKDWMREHKVAQGRLAWMWWHGYIPANQMILYSDGSRGEAPADYQERIVHRVPKSVWQRYVVQYRAKV